MERSPSSGFSFHCRVRVGQRLFTADVQGTKCHRFVTQGCQHLAVDQVLLGLRGKRRPDEKGKFGAVEADARRTHLPCQRQFAQQIDIGQQIDPRTIPGVSGAHPSRCPMRGHLLADLIAGIETGNDGRRWIHIDVAHLAVHQYRRRFGEVHQFRALDHHHGNFQGAGDDGHV